MNDLTVVVNTTRLTGRIGTVPSGENYGFILLTSVQKVNGDHHGLETDKDIFIHQDECRVQLRPGLQVAFDVVPRSGYAGEFRATGATQIVDAELVPPHEITIPGFSFLQPFNVSTEMQIAQTKLPIHQRMKGVPPATVAQVVKNRPMPNIPRQFGRGTSSEEAEMLKAFLIHLFPYMQEFVTNHSVLDIDDVELDRIVEQARGKLTNLGMKEHAVNLQSNFQRFKVAREALKFSYGEGLVRPDTIVPIHYLPDLFMAVPVWFFYADQENQDSIKETNTNDDPSVHPWTKYFCDLFPRNARWANTFQLYNRRLRSLADYGGEGFDVITPTVVNRLEWASNVFDFVVIATPYHDLAAREWQDSNWLRGIDPYVLGFMKGIPYFFVLARFSDSGTFPLYHQLVGDTIEFLRTNKDGLKSFNSVRPYWYGKPGPGTYFDVNCAGTYLIAHVDDLLQAFLQENLFGWLRMEDGSVQIV